MGQTRIEQNMHVAGAFSCQSLAIPPLTVTDAMIAAAAAIGTAKQIHRYAVSYSQADGTAVAAAIVPVHVVRGATGTIAAVEVSCMDAPSGGDLTFTVDVGIQAAGEALATVLTGVRTYPNATADGTVLAATVDDGTLADGDTVAVTIAVSGSTGVQGQGLVVTIAIDEDPA